MRIKRGFRRRPLILTAAFLLSFLISAVGCNKVVRIPVTEEDVIRANEAALQADQSFAQKDFYAALIKYLESVKYNPNNAFVYNRLGIAYARLELYEQAVDSFRRSIELNPKYPFAYNNLGSVFFAQRSLKRAEKYLKKAISMKGDEASFHMNMGSLHLEKKRRDKAMAEWRRALALDPNILSGNTSISLIGGTTATRERHYFIARLLASTGEVEPAIESLKKAIAEGFDDVEMIGKEPDFSAIRSDARFVKFLDEAQVLIKLRSGVGLPGN